MKHKNVMTIQGKARVLCVDDEPRILEGLKNNLRRKYEVTTSMSAAEALNEIRNSSHDFAAIVSDMRMPNMSGAAFLRKAREESPNSTRILLTGFSEMDSAVEAINEGGIFRFLTKPCGPDVLGQALDDAVTLHHQVEAEQILLEQTLKESLNAVCQVLAIAHPEAYGRALRIERLISEAAKGLPVAGWELSIAAMLSQLGWATLDKENLAMALCGRAAPEIGDKIDRARELPVTLFSKIPKIDAIKTLLRAAVSSPNLTDAFPRRLLRATIALDDAFCRSVPRTTILEMITLEHGKDVAKALERVLISHESVRPTVVNRDGLRTGMVLDQDLRNTSGALVLPEGVALTPTMVEKLQSMPKDNLPTQISVRIQALG